MALKKMFLILMISAVAVSGFAGGSGDGSSGGSAKPVEFKVGLLGDIQTLNFWASNDINMSAIMEAVMPRFGFMDTDGMIKPHLFTDIEIKDNSKTFILHVKPGLKWHDGTPFTAHDVVFTGEYLMEYKLFQNTRYSNVASARAIDDLTVEYKLNNPQTGFMDVIMYWVSPVPKHIFEKVTDPMNFNYESTGVVGLGPFKMSEWKKGEYYIADRNPDWPADMGTPKLERLIYRVYKDENSLALALKTGEIDTAARHVLPSVANQFRNDRNFSLFEMQSPGYAYMGFNGEKSEFAADPAVRRAIAMCVDRPKIVRLALEGNGIPMPGSVSPIYKEFTSSNINYPAFDIEAAKRALANAGYADTNGDGIVEKNGKKLSLRIMYEGARSDYDRSVRVIKEDAAKAGIELILDPVDRQVYMDRQNRTKEYEMMFVQWGAIVVIYDSFYNLYGKDAYLNYANFYDPNLEKWAKAAKESPSIPDTIKPMEEAQKVVVDLCPTIGVWVPNLIYVNSAKFDGYIPYYFSFNGTLTMGSLINISPK
ncbi:ABC transporter substrate-binding protein [Breznakiella homolactica]|uniref:ABC transporter substrate-binding protein n=1 Tax=Breznakiella homolactica TaxID=2798577 RepID=A0A7T7XLG0_9SPIR|nr:ABC transporter substrate-binding protein [Breznakiella homolactica]QQO08442.1 ABC transporter substrate-binding protein [Breznakiella homolactica]